MTRHLLCLTVDTDPDGLSGKITNRETLVWNGLENLRQLPAELHSEPQLASIRLTWFIRADGQLESILGNAGYLLEKYAAFWTSARNSGDELGWHPHLYRQVRTEDAAVLISDAHEAQDELERLWSKIRTMLPATSFRHGEGWHLPNTYSTIERLGFQCDSTAIPGRKGTRGHPMNWGSAPNYPFFPDEADLCKPGRERPMLEIPMNTWLMPAPYDDAPRLRYMNPAVHPHLFAKALRSWENTSNFSSDKLSVWVMILHPDEVLSSRGDDLLYSRSTKALRANLGAFQESLERAGVDFEWVTIGEAATRWRMSRGTHIL